MEMLRIETIFVIRSQWGGSYDRALYGSRKGKALYPKCSAHRRRLVVLANMACRNISAFPRLARQ